MSESSLSGRHGNGAAGTTEAELLRLRLVTGGVLLALALVWLGDGG